MGRFRITLTAACAATLLTTGMAAAQGTLEDRKTIVTFSGPVSLPGTTLPAGTYVFRLADSPSNRNIVHVFDRDEAKVITTLLAVPAQRNEAEGDPVITFKETPSDRPPAVHYWYYAGERAGNEFVYPRTQAMAIARASGEAVSAMDTDGSDVSNWKGDITKVTADTAAQSATAGSGAAGTTATGGTSTAANGSTSTTGGDTTAAATSQAPATTSGAGTGTTAPATTTPASSPAASTPASPETASTPAASTPARPERPVGTSGRSELPRTASSLPAAGLIGLFALLAAFGVRAARLGLDR